MASLSFVDSNVFVYTVDSGEPVKRERAREVLEAEAGNVVLSAQVLSEVYWTVTRKLRPAVTPDAASDLTDVLRSLPVTPVDGGLVRAGVAIAREAQLAYWEGLIVAAARVSGCGRVLTEDMAHGSVVAGVRIEDPFRPAVG